MGTVAEDGFACGASLALGGAAFAGYALCCAPAAYLLDSGELAAAAFGLGIAHPPGETLAALWGKLFTLLPVGSVAFRVGLGQAVAAALATVLLFRIAVRLFGWLTPATGRRGAAEGGGLGPRGRALVAAASALGFAFAPGVVIVADRPEVYALQAALALGAALLALRALDERDARWLLLASGLIGLGLATHPLVAGLAGAGATLAALPFLWRPRETQGSLTRFARVRLVGWSVAALGAGAAVLAYLPARAAALYAGAAAGGADTIAWGDARTPAGLAWLLSATTFATKASVVHGVSRPFDLPFLFMEELEPVFAFLVPVGAFFLLRRRPARLPAAVVIVAGAGGGGGGGSTRPTRTCAATSAWASRSGRCWPARRSPPAWASCPAARWRWPSPPCSPPAP
jgi:hypothetical protein